MGGLSKAKKKIRSIHDKATKHFNPLTGMPTLGKNDPNPLNKAVAKQKGKMNDKIRRTADEYVWGPDAEEEAAKQQAETDRLIASLRQNDKVIPMADEEELSRSRRRRRSRSGGRADTVLSDALGG